MSERKECKNPSPFRGKNEVDPQALIEETWDHYWSEFKGEKEGHNRAIHKGSCTYRRKDGYACSIGRLIPDDEYDLSMEGVSVSDDSIPQSSLPDIVGIESEKGKKRFYDEMQGDLHDFPNCYSQAYWEAASFVEKMNKTFNLNLKPPFDE